jgi:hypothetical protein
MQMHRGIAGAAALRRDDLDQIAYGRRVDRLQKSELFFGHHEIFSLCAAVASLISLWNMIFPKNRYPLFGIML